MLDVGREPGGRVFQIGRPSGISYMMLAARMNALTYPDADQNATASPMTVAIPAAPWLLCSDWSTGHGPPLPGVRTSSRSISARGSATVTVSPG